ncbi:uncharacterized protein LOC127751199 [Frankliniella occidentalis]|uniref:Uncharacterized protein LOC127751199 n=1 Tax=Frankliniella occidentalis TaxID=133901 RepID=A0A9C6XT50_FRAOC|nr:uncharacterized protein LOC127751199 [Frankliniella occidentalis]
MARDQCLKCKNNLNISAQSTVKCVKCEKYIHLKCLNNTKESEDLNPETTNSYTCQRCHVLGEVKGTHEHVDEDDEDDSNGSFSLNSSSASSISVEGTIIEETRVKELEKGLSSLQDKVHSLLSRIEKLESERCQCNKKQESARRNLEIKMDNNQNVVNIEPRTSVKSEVNKIRMIEKDILTAPIDITMVHCVGRDLLLSDGIAKRIKERYQLEEKLKEIDTTGRVAVQTTGAGRKIIHLITKEKSKDKPKWNDFKKAIQELRSHCVDNEIKKIWMPKIGCGLDRLKWKEVMELLKIEFQETNVEVTVCYLGEKEEKEYRETIKNKRMKKEEINVKPKIEVHGDSQVKNLGKIMNQELREFNTLVLANPGATTRNITEELNRKRANLTPDDCIVFVTGSNDEELYENNRIEMISQANHTRVIITSAPMRYDHEEFYRNDILRYNEKLKNLIEKERQKLIDPGRIQYIDLNTILGRFHFTEHGLHLNVKGKEKLTEEIMKILYKNKEEGDEEDAGFGLFD